MQNEIDWLSQFKPRIVKNIDLKTYNEYSDERLDGHLPKEFFRAPSCKMPDLFNEIQNNINSSYITYCNNVAKEGMVLEYISVLKKNCGNYVYHLPEREAMVSKLLNYMGIPTTYNLVSKHTKINSKDTKNEEYEVLSVDFVGANETFYSLEDLGINSIQNLYGAIEKIKKAFLKFGFDSKAKRNENLKEVISQFVLTYMVRGYLLGDNDFKSRNIGFIYNSETKQIRLVNYDYEQAFMADMRIVLEGYGDYEEPTFLFVKQEYPEEYKRFMEITKEFYSKLENLREIDLLKHFNKNISRFFILLKENAGAISNFDEMLNKKTKYGKISHILSNAKKTLKNDWSGM